MSGVGQGYVWEVLDVTAWADCDDFAYVIEFVIAPCPMDEAWKCAAVETVLPDRRSWSVRWRLPHLVRQGHLRTNTAGGKYSRQGTQGPNFRT